jgi:hypothetical protein
MQNFQIVETTAFSYKSNKQGVFDMKINQIVLPLITVCIACFLCCASSSSTKKTNDAVSTQKSVPEIIYNNAEDFEYTKQNKSIIITKYIGTSKIVNIPPVIEGLPVIEIAEGAFKRNNGQIITSIHIPKSVKTIGSSTLYYYNKSDGYYKQNFPTISIEKGANIKPVEIHRGDYSNFGYHIIVSGDDIYAVAHSYNGSSKNATIPNMIKGVPLKALGLFGGHSKSKSQERLNNLIIPEGVIRIGKGALKDYNLIKVKLPKSLIYIDDNAFSGNHLIDIEIPEGVKYIGAYAFYGNKLTSVTIPDSVISIGEGAFDNNKGQDILGIQKEYTLATNFQNNKDYANAVKKFRFVLRLNQNHSGAKAGLMFSEYELANANNDKVNYATAITLYRKVLELDSDHTGAKSKLKTLWDRRIAENQKIYPAPFDGKWQFIIKVKIIPAYEEHYFEKVQDGYYENYTEGNKPGTKRRWVNRYTQELRKRYIPEKIIPEQKFVYEFNGTNYISYIDGKQYSSGTFFYNGNNIELENGTILKISNNGIQEGEKIFTKQ